MVNRDPLGRPGPDLRALAARHFDPNSYHRGPGARDRLVAALDMTDVTAAVVLDRVDDIDQADTDYCVHGRVVCGGGCGHWLWLGNRAYDLVTARRTVPLCRPCATRIIGPEHPVDRNAGDHRRADGPHP